MLTVADIAKAMATLKAERQPMRRMTLSRSEVDELRLRSVPYEGITGSSSWIFGVPMVERSDGNYRLVRPEDRQHIAEHGDGLDGCDRCFRIWWEESLTHGQPTHPAALDPER